MRVWRGRRRIRGFGLLEVMVALALLAGVLVGVAGLFTVAARANRSSRAASRAALLASQKLEQLMGLAWGFGPEGEDRIDLRTDAASWPETQAGRGLASSPAGALSSNTPGFVDYLDDRGQWIGTGPSPPGNTVYVRRWSIQPLPGSPLDTLILRVVVFSKAPNGRLSAGTAPFDAAQVTCLRSRRGT